MTIKVCPKCGSENRMILKTGYTQCKDCHSSRTREYSRKIKRNYPWNKTPAAKEYRKTWQLKNRYGLERHEYDAMIKKQNGVCAICGKIDNVDLCVDHDHKTGIVRGLLCNKCNVGLANYRDSAEALRKAADYLDRAALLTVDE